ncbi:MAG: CBS domain-containing protein [Pirellulales bacterium]
MLTAREVMVHDVVAALPTATVRETIEVLVRERMSGLPVVDERGDLQGIITEYALLEALYDSNVLDETIAGFMTCKVISVGEETPLTKVADQMVLHRIRCLPVVRNGRVVGLVGRSEVLRAALVSGRKLGGHAASVSAAAL